MTTDAGPYGNGQENLSQSIRRQGVQRPVDIGHGRHGDAKWVKQPILLNGNTRVSTALALNPDQLMPVVHHKNPRQSIRGIPDWAERVPEAFGWKDRF